MFFLLFPILCYDVIAFFYHIEIAIEPIFVRFFLGFVRFQSNADEHIISKKSVVARYKKAPRIPPRGELLVAVTGVEPVTLRV